LDCFIDYNAVVVSETGGATSSSSSSSKRPRLDQLPAANLDADDPLDDDVSVTFMLICSDAVGKASCRLKSPFLPVLSMLA